MSFYKHYFIIFEKIKIAKMSVINCIIVCLEEANDPNASIIEWEVLPLK